MQLFEKYRPKAWSDVVPTRPCERCPWALNGLGRFGHNRAR